MLGVQAAIAVVFAIAMIAAILGPLLDADPHDVFANIAPFVLLGGYS